MRLPVIGPVVGVLIISLGVFVGLEVGIDEQGSVRAEESRDDSGKASSEIDRRIDKHVKRTVEEGRWIFRFDTFGSETFFGDALQLHKAIAGSSRQNKTVRKHGTGGAELALGRLPTNRAIV